MVQNVAQMATNRQIWQHWIVACFWSFILKNVSPGYGLLGHAQAMARNQKNEVSFVIHNLPVVAKMGAVAKACGNMFQLSQGHSPETSGGLLICLPREQAAAYCKVIDFRD